MNLEETFVRILQERKQKVTTIESCTGGLLASCIVNVSGASSVFNEGYITYSNEAKHRLVGVKEATLEQYGAVSEETALEMAIGGAYYAKSSVALSITGIAGPRGGTFEKPVGLVYIGCFFNNNATVKKCILHGTREEIRNETVKLALQFAIEVVLAGDET